MGGLRDGGDADWIGTYNRHPGDAGAPAPGDGYDPYRHTPESWSTTPAFGPAPPIPDLPAPTAVAVAGPLTSDQLAVALARRTTPAGRTLVTILLIVAASLAVLWFLAPILAVALAGSIVAIAILQISARRKAVPKFREHFGRYTAPGQTMASRFDERSFDIRADTFHIRVPYTSVAKLEADDHTVSLQQDGVFTAYPRELFPDSMIEHLGGKPAGSRIGRPPSAPAQGPTAPNPDAK